MKLNPQVDGWLILQLLPISEDQLSILMVMEILSQQWEV